MVWRGDDAAQFEILRRGGSTIVLVYLQRKSMEMSDFISMTQPSLYHIYCQECQQKGWVADPQMHSVCDQVDHVYGEFYRSSQQWLPRLFRSSVAPLQGVYLSGPVGRGKSYLMDLFYQTCLQSRKARWHFTEFMQLIHQQLASFSREEDKKKCPQRKGQPIQQVAHQIARQYDVICLDEFQVTEIAEAMILYRLFQQFIQEGIFFVVTSNCAPEELYRGGLHYDRFEPFVHLIRESWRHVKFTDEVGDYRRLGSGNSGDIKKTLASLFADYRQKEGQETVRLTVYGREIIFDQATQSTLWATFSQVCDQPFGSAEYQAIAKKFQTVFLSDIPLLNSENRDAARRFITLIDCLYDENVRLYVNPDLDPDQLYSEHGPQALPFARTASRLIQMRKRSMGL